MRARRLVLLAAGVATLAGAGAVLRLPTEAECRASGRTVDPTRRHCLDGAGYVQLREHAVWHVTTAAPLLLVPAAGVALFRLARRRRPAA